MQNNDPLPAISRLETTVTAISVIVHQSTLYISIHLNFNVRNLLYPAILYNKR